MPTARNFFNQQEQALLIEAIAKAELNTSGEIRLHLENFCWGNEVKVAKKVFTRLKMHETKERNGVLIYIATLSRKIAIIGDEGIHQKLGTEYWEKLVEKLIMQFKANRKAEALAECILECGTQLGKFFPLGSDDKNELSNTISY
jgi:uncharacterized membrane protein